MPIISGFKAKNITLNHKQLKHAHDINGSTTPESLYEAQLELRLGHLPSWLTKARR